MKGISTHSYIHADFLITQHVNTSTLERLLMGERLRVYQLLK